jgi:hypothetical protein
MSPAAREFEDFAKDCVRLAGQAENPELRERLLKIAGHWMQAAMDEPETEQRRPRRLKSY